MKTPKSPDPESRTESALGALQGALAGDAAGATLEMLGRRPDKADVMKAMMMFGGGVWKTAPGQITDDGELTLALALALNGQTVYDQARVAMFYRRWFLSKPFDIGITTGGALRDGDLDSPDLLSTILTNSVGNNLPSQANGSLMRLSALGIWSAGVSLEDAIAAARLDARLTHPNPNCQWSAAAYVVAMRHLILHSGDAAGAVIAAASMLDRVEAKEVSQWIAEAKTETLPPFHPQPGHVRIAFTNAFHHLYRRTAYDEALHKTLMQGGDTDTNACIVGGLLGALHGAGAIPLRMRKAIITCDTSRGRPRPAWLHSSQAETLVQGLLWRK